MAALLLFICALATPARADTVASLLGDFTINQYCEMQLADRQAKLHFVIVFGQLPALRELHQADANGDGVTTQQERDAYVSTLAPGYGRQLVLTVDGATIPLHATSWTSSLPKEQTGFSLRVDIDYAGVLPSTADGRSHALALDNKNFPGRIGWHELVVDAASGLQAFDTNAYSTSLTGGLANALASLPAAGPLDERAVHLSYARTAPAGAHLLGPRDGTAQPPAATPAAPAGDTAWLAVQTRRLIDLISTPHVPVHIVVFALLAAMVLGALHALSPGHGKSIVGAYLVGSRGTPRHAMFLGITVTITHTLVVFALGLVTLFASSFILPERLFPILSLVSGLLVFGMGAVLLAQRWKAARFFGGGLAGHARRHGHGHDHGHAHGHDDGHSHAHAAVESHVHADDHDHGHAHDHGHDHDMAHGHSHDHPHHLEQPHASGAHAHASAGLTHSHGGSVHSHLPPGADGGAITWRGLLALGVSGGLLPCPSAMVLLLAAIALNKTLFGLVLVVAFSVGLAMTLIAVGLVFLYARNRFQSRLTRGRWPDVLPVLSAASITVLGGLLCIGSLVASPL